jgi:hypothetical protein
METDEWFKCRGIAIEAILGTDMALHFETFGSLKMKMQTCSELKEADRLYNTKLALKIADVSHTTKILSAHLSWT